MASTLCCTAEQESRPNSPELPNARLSGATPAKQPLLPKPSVSPNSRFTSFRSEEFHELHQIFDHARDNIDEDVAPARASRARFNRVSIYSLRSLHNMTSMRSLLKRKFSRDLSMKETAVKIHIEAAQNTVVGDQDTVVRAFGNEAKQQLKITKDDLRKDLLSTKKPDEGGYDSDAEILDDLARNIGKKTPNKRASIHSVNWSPSTGSKATPGSSAKSRTDTGGNDHDLQPYQIQKHPSVSLATRISHVFSTPDLQIDVSDDKKRVFRRSQSATSMGLPQVSPISPLSPFRLPSLSDHDHNGVPWAEAINDSLRLSHLSNSSCHVISQDSHILLPVDSVSRTLHHTHQSSDTNGEAPLQGLSERSFSTPDRPFENRFQKPISVVSLRPSDSAQGKLQEKSLPSDLKRKEDLAQDDNLEREENPRHSVHLYSMRISHHLRSGSLLSWEQLADAPALPHIRPFRDRTASDQSQKSHLNKQVARHDRQTSSSGFASSRVPAKWGKVMSSDHDVRGDVASSIYSSRPQSPPDSFVASLTSLGRIGTVHDETKATSMPSARTYQSNSHSADNEETSRVTLGNRQPDLRTVQAAPTMTTPDILARKNSVADTKKSKFREEFSPSPPRKTVAPSESIAKLLNLKRLSARSQSEAFLRAEPTIRSGDAAIDTLDVPHARERRQSLSIVSLQAEQKALDNAHGADHVWNQALKAHQDEKACLFLPKNRDLALHASPFRERSGSIMTRHSCSEGSNPATPLTSEVQTSSRNIFAPSYYFTQSPRTSTSEEPSRCALVSRRSAIASSSVDDAARDISIIFEKQGDSSDIVGAWGRYPSHTRDERTNSAGKADRVKSRDFALEAAIKFASAQNIDEDMIDPMDRIPSMPLLPGEKRMKKKNGTGHRTKSSSMKFGKMFLKNYSNIFKSSSAEFRQHGRNHRSSVATGGVLDFPELELLPEVGNRRASVIGDGSQSHLRQPIAMRQLSDGHPADQEQARDSMATLRPRRNSSAPNLNEISYDGASDDRRSKENARIWSIYYDDCVPSYPRASMELTTDLDDFSPARFSFESRRPSMHSHTMPARLARHSRNVSHVGYTSAVSRASASRTSTPRDDDSDILEKRSMVSIRRSTMDLISKFKEQEIVEHERVLSMTRAGSRYESAVLTAL